MKKHMLIIFSKDIPQWAEIRGQEEIGVANSIQGYGIWPIYSYDVQKWYRLYHFDLGY